MAGKSIPAGADNGENEAGGNRKHSEHPVLAIEAKKGKMLDQKVQRPRAPHVRGNISAPASKIYYFYISHANDMAALVPPIRSGH